jgi:hypothetical protein
VVLKYLEIEEVDVAPRHILLCTCPPTSVRGRRGRLLKSKTFLSKHGLQQAVPRHRLPSLKSLEAEVVDAGGAPVPLREAYLHHWIVEPYHVAAGEAVVVAARNSVRVRLLESETRRTATWVPDPYGIEIGSLPEGYEERCLQQVASHQSTTGSRRVANN